MTITIKTNHLVIAGIALLTWFLGAFFTWSGMAWYKMLTLPPITPPNWVFHWAWRIIFVCTTIAAIRVWNQFERDFQFLLIMALFGINTFLNAYWSFLFFRQHQIGAALLDAIALELTVIGLIILLKPNSRFNAFLLVPYACWGIFAIVLNVLIWQAN